MCRACLFFLLLLGAARLCPALVVEGAAEATSTSAPSTNDFGFANVAQVFNTADGFYCSGIYLGNGWLISAYHVVRDRQTAGAFAFGEVHLAGGVYTVDASSAVLILNADHTATDLAVFRLSVVPAGLTGMSIATADPSFNTQVALAGDGVGRAASETHWNVETSTNPDTWTETTDPGAHQGFYLTGGQAIRWGTNRLAGSVASLDDGIGVQNALFTNFSASTNGEAQGAAGDSGGGLFYQSAGGWQLLGITLATSDPIDGQPSTLSPSAIRQDSAVYGNETYFADLPTYRTQIMAAIPEPGSAALLLSAALLAARRVRTQKWLTRPPRDL